MILDDAWFCFCYLLVKGDLSCGWKVYNSLLKYFVPSIESSCRSSDSWLHLNFQNKMTTLKWISDFFFFLAKILWISNTHSTKCRAHRKKIILWDCFRDIFSFAWTIWANPPIHKMSTIRHTRQCLTWLDKDMMFSIIAILSVS